MNAFLWVCAVIAGLVLFVFACALCSAKEPQPLTRSPLVRLIPPDEDAA